MRITTEVVSSQGPHGLAQRRPGGGVTVRASRDQCFAWAHRHWPCATLARLTGPLFAEFAPNGDLVDVSHPGVGDVPADEFNAFTDDVKAYLYATLEDAELYGKDAARVRADRMADDQEG